MACQGQFKKIIIDLVCSCCLLSCIVLTGITHARRTKDDFSASEWCEIQNPKRMGRGLLAEGDWVWYMEDNKWGECAGQVIDPFGATLKVRWADGEVLPIARNLCRRAIPHEVTIMFNDSQKKITYTATGVALSEPETQTKNKNLPEIQAPTKKASARTTRTATKKSSATKKSPAKTKKNARSKRKVAQPNKSTRSAKKPKNKPEKTTKTTTKKKKTAGKPKLFRWQYFHPQTDEALNTAVTIPGPAFDTITDKVIMLAKIDEDGKLYLSNGATRNNRHVRAATRKEVANYTKGESASEKPAASAPTSIAESWAPCDNVPALGARLVAKLGEYMCECLPEDNNTPLHHLFVERVAKIYKHQHGKTAKDSEDEEGAMHVNREAICHDACEKVLAQAPIRQRPYKGSARRAAKQVLPILEFLFHMPGRGPAVGSEAWLANLKTDTTLITFRQLTTYPELMKAHIQYTLRTCFNARGELRLQKGELVPTKGYKYDADEGPPKAASKKLMIRSTKRAMHKHKDFKPLRSGGVVWALDKLHTHGVYMEGLYPQRMHPDTMPKESGRKKWNNYNHTKIAFHSYYCDAQGNHP